MNTTEATSDVATLIEAVDAQLAVWNSMPIGPFAKTAWVNADEGKLFFRLTRRLLPDQEGLVPTLDLANVEVSRKFRRQGVFSRLLDHMEMRSNELGRTLFVESVLSPHVKKVLLARGYVQHGEPECPHFYRLALAVLENKDDGSRRLSPRTVDVASLSRPRRR